MKAALITLHHVRNYGSLLQTYASQVILEKMGYEVEVIDFIPKGLTLVCGIRTIRSTGRLWRDLLRKGLATLLFTIAQCKMRSFLKKYIHLSQGEYHSFKELQAKPPQADVYISGSDQVWNTQNANEVDDLKAYYLDFVQGNNARRIGFACSIGKDEFSKEEAANVRSWLKRYDAISVREKQAVDMIHALGNGLSATQVLDPTLLLTKEEWDEFLDINHKSIFCNKNYILVYNLNRNPYIKKFARKLAQQFGCEIVNFASTLDFIKGAKNYIIPDVFLFLDGIRNAQYVVTDSFHGTAFSINFQKTFWVFPPPKYCSRIVSILSLFRLVDRLMVNTLPNKEICVKEIDWNDVSECLREERNRTWGFLDMVKMMKRND